MIKNIIFDFDGVVLDSIPVKSEGFRKLFEDFPKNKVDELIEYHMYNGGMSRYKKIEYFFQKILGQEIKNKQILEYAEKYSEITKEELSQKKYLIDDSLYFIQKQYKKYNMHIASGADENDLKYICNRLDLEKYFLSIKGSPKVKSDIVSDILVSKNYRKKETVLIGDSINDYEAARDNGIIFYGYNNISLQNKPHYYLTTFLDFETI